MWYVRIMKYPGVNIYVYIYCSFVNNKCTKIECNSFQNVLTYMKIVLITNYAFFFDNPNYVRKIAHTLSCMEPLAGPEHQFMPNTVMWTVL